MLTRDALDILEIPEFYDMIALKQAYRKKLLASHPDKTSNGTITVQDVQTAYEHLLALHARESKVQGNKIVDLDEFEYADGTYTLDCRCGHAFQVTEQDLEQGRDIVGCHGCSLFVRIAYEENQEEEDAP